MALAGSALLGHNGPGWIPTALRSSGRGAAPAGAELALGALAAAGALYLAGALGFAPDNDGYARLARATAAPPWLTLTQTKPLEILLASVVGVLPLDPLLAWRALGALHVGICAVLVARIAAHGLGSGAAAARSSWRALGPFAAAFLVVSAPLFLQHALAMNSVTTLAAALLLWVDRRLAGDARGCAVALALVGLSRLDGLVLAGLLAAASAAQAGWGSRLSWRRLLLEGAPVALAAVLWLATDRVANGRWLGFLTLAGAQFELLPPPRFDVPGIARWLRGAWLSHASECVLLLAGVGAALAVVRPRHALGATARALAVALIAHHVILALLGLTGRSLFYRYFVPDLVLGLALAALGFAGLVRGLLPAATRVRTLLVGLLAVLAFGDALLDVRQLGDAAREVRSRSAGAAAAERCLARWLGEAEGLTVVVPSRLHGELTWRLREAPIGQLLYEEWFFAALDPSHPRRADRKEDGSGRPPVLWLGAEGDPRRVSAAERASRAADPCEGAAAPLSVRLLTPSR